MAQNTDQVVVRGENGTFLFFPSWLQHSVDPNQRDEPRIKVSFNMMFSEYTETMSNASGSCFCSADFALQVLWDGMDYFARRSCTP
jgi:hypothetical protein